MFYLIIRKKKLYDQITNIKKKKKPGECKNIFNYNKVLTFTFIVFYELGVFLGAMSMKSINTISR